MVQDDYTNPQLITSKPTHSWQDVELYKPMMKSDQFLYHHGHHERIDPGQIEPTNWKCTQELLHKHDHGGSQPSQDRDG